ncbi:MAG: PIN domain-containing protein [Deinococcota bacterium]
MKVLFDSSVLIPSLIRQHANYEAAHACFTAHVYDDNTEVYASAHTLAETYSSITGYRPWKISAVQAKQAIDNLRPHLSVITLNEDDYMWVFNRMASLNLVGAVIYDCLHARAALKAEVTALYTFNTKDFVRLSDDVQALVREP